MFGVYLPPNRDAAVLDSPPDWWAVAIASEDRIDLAKRGWRRGSGVQTIGQHYVTAVNDVLMSTLVRSGFGADNVTSRC